MDLVRCATIALVVAGAACGKVVGDLPDSDGATGSADAPITSGDASGVTTIKAVRTSPPGQGAAVALRGVVVIAREATGTGANLVVQDADGGDFSGIIVFCNLQAGGMCSLSRNDIETMPIGQIIDVNATFDVVQPEGTPTPPGQPRLVRPTVVTHGTVTPMPRMVAASLLAPDQAGVLASRALLWTYVQVNGPIVVSAIDPQAFRQACPVPIDAGVPNGSHRAVVTRVAATTDLAVGMRRGDVNANYCLFECEWTCANQLAVSDTFQFIAGIPDTFNRANERQLIVVTPVRNTDVGPKQ
jgi:hypothetical protein